MTSNNLQLSSLPNVFHHPCFLWGFFCSIRQTDANLSRPPGSQVRNLFFSHPWCLSLPPHTISHHTCRFKLLKTSYMHTPASTHWQGLSSSQILPLKSHSSSLLTGPFLCHSSFFPIQWSPYVRELSKTNCEAICATTLLNIFSWLPLPCKIRFHSSAKCTRLFQIHLLPTWPALCLSHLVFQLF